MAEPKLLLFFVTSNDLTKCFKKLFEDTKNYPFEGWNRFNTTPFPLNQSYMYATIPTYTKKYGYIFDLNISKNVTDSVKISAKIIAKSQDEKTNYGIVPKQWSNQPHGQNQKLILNKEVNVDNYLNKTLDALNISNLLNDDKQFNYICRFFIIDTEEHEDSEYFNNLDIKKASRVFIPANWQDFPIFENKYIFDGLYNKALLDNYIIFILPCIGIFDSKEKKWNGGGDDDDDDNDNYNIENMKQTLDNNIYWNVYQNNKNSNDNFIGIALNNLKSEKKIAVDKRIIDGDQLEEGSSHFSGFSGFFGGIRSRKKSIKKTKKTRKPRKTSRKTRKHKKSRKH